MKAEEAIELIDSLLKRTRKKGLKTKEKITVEGVWLDKTYTDIAEEVKVKVKQEDKNDPYNYIRNTIALNLYKDIGEALKKLGIEEEKVLKNNFRKIIESNASKIKEKLQSESEMEPKSPPIPDITPRKIEQLEQPERPLSSCSKVYVERPPVEQNLKNIIFQPGALARIKAPKYMGKTSLLNRSLYLELPKNYQVVSLNFKRIDIKILSDLERFLRWFCITVGKQIKLPNKIDEYWKVDEVGSSESCNDYFREYILEEIDDPIVIALDNVDRIFPYFDVAEDFLGLLRSWHEDAVTDETLKKLRLILVHSTEVYIPLDIKQSPFNVGVSIELPEFDLEQIQELANRYNLSFKTEEIKKISSILGGHPYLISLAFYHITCKNLSLEEILKQAPSDLGIYKEHLQRYLNDLEETPKLAAAMKKTIKETSPVQLERQEKFKLLSMGLIKLKDNGVIPSCELYRQYFENQLDNF